MLVLIAQAMPINKQHGGDPGRPTAADSACVRTLVLYLHIF